MNARPLVLRILFALACVGVTAACVVHTYRTQFAAPKFNVPLHQAVGRVMAQETAKLINQTGKVVVVAMETGRVPELQTQLDEFERVLQQFPQIRIKEKYELEADQPKYSFGTGLSGRRYVRIVNKNLSAAAIVSFVGVPSLSDEEVVQLKKSPLFLAETRSADKLKKLFEQKVLQVAVVSRFQFPTPIKGKPHSPQEWFEQRFQIVTPAHVADLPAGTEE